MQVPDQAQIEQALTIILTTTNEAQRKEADNFLRQLEKENASLLITLINIFENNPNPTIKQQSIILLKNVVVRQWIKNSIYGNKRVVHVPDQVKEIIKEKILYFLGLIPDSNMKKEINLVIQQICKHDFPQKYPQLVAYFQQGLQTIIQQPEPSQNSVDLIITLKYVVAEMAKKRIVPMKQQQAEFNRSIWVNLCALWQNTTNVLESKILQGDEVQIYNAVIISKRMDRVLSLSLMSYHAENDLEIISQVFQTLLIKVAMLIKNKNKIIERNLKTLVHSLTNLQHIFCLSFSCLNDYLEMLKIVINSQWDDKRIVKAGLIGMAKVLKTYFYYCTDEQFHSSIVNSKNPQYKLIKQNSYVIFHNFFQNNIQTILEGLIQLAQSNIELTEEEIIEQEEDNSIDDMKNELECPIYTLCLINAEQLMLRFPDAAMNSLQLMLNQIQAGNYSIHPILFDNYLSILGQAPRVIYKLQKPFTIDIIPVLQYLQIQNTQRSIRRCAVLINRFLISFRQDQYHEIIQLVIFLMKQSTDTIVRYQALMALKTILQNSTLQIEWNQLIAEVAPIIVGLLQTFVKPTIIWPLLQLLQKLIEKSQSQQQVVLKAFSEGNLFNLVSTDQELLVDALCDMFKAVIIQFKIGHPITSIYQLCLQLIRSNIHKKKSSILSLYLFILQEYDEVQNVKEELTMLINSNLKLLFKDLDLQNIQVILQIIEEHVLLQIFPPQVFPDIIILLEDRFKLANSLQVHDIGVYIKNACLSLTQTVLIYILNNHIEIFQLMVPLIKSISVELISFSGQLHHEILYQVQAYTIMNRLIIQDTTGFLNLVQIAPDVYFEKWMTAAIRHKDAMRLNLLALLHFLPMVQKQLIQQNLEEIFEDVLGQIKQEEMMQDPQMRLQLQQSKQTQRNSTHARMNYMRQSERKELLNQSTIPNITIKEACIRVFKDLQIDLSGLTNELRQQVIQVFSE